MHESDLTLVHVYAEVPPSPDVTVPTVMHVWEEQRRWVAQELERRVAEAEARGVQARAVLKLGAAAHGLLEAARQTHADLVVVGTHGRTGLEHVFLGSVAEQVVRTAPCPCSR